jgi:uncharacterized protein YecE (DUF72 family)
MLAEFGIARASADPPIVQQPGPVLYMDTVYIRLHGAPVIYHSVYSDEYLKRLAADIRNHENSGRHVWCIFDNTASGAAMPNALFLMSSLGQNRRSRE